MRTGVAWAAVSGTIACSCLFLGSPALAQATQLDVPAEDAGKSIPELARQAGIQVVAPGAQLHGFITPAIKGTYDAVAALKLMLKGTDLVVSRSSDGILTISLREKEDQEERQGMNYQPKASVSILALIFGTLAGGAAYAQNDQQVETVVVTGVRASLQSSQEIKKNADQFVDSIVAEDIGKLPDNTIIDAMQHITGVQVQHTSGAGETNSFLIHGLPDIATTLNGRQIFTTTGRTISLADIPAELLARVDVKKSIGADDLEGGIAGLINAVFHRPFDFDGLEIAGGLKGVYSSQAEHVDPDASFLISNRWNTSIGEVGFLFDINYNKRHYQDYDAFNYYTATDHQVGLASEAANHTTLAYTPETMGAITYPGKRERAGLNLVGQWRPTQDVEVYAELFYTRYRNLNEVNYLIGLPGKGLSGYESLTTVTDPDGNSVLKTGVTDSTSDTFQLTSNQAYRDKTDTYQLALGANYTGDSLTLSSEIAYTDSKYQRIGAIVDTAFWGRLAFDTNYNNSGTPNISLADSSTNLLDSSGYAPTQFFDQWTRQKGNEFDWKADGNYQIGGILKSVDFGLRYANRYGKNRAANGGVLSCYNSVNSRSKGDTQYEQEVAASRSAACGYVDDNTSAWWGVRMETILPGSMAKSHGKFFGGDLPWGVTEWMNLDANYAFDHIKDIRAAFGQSTDEPAADLSNSFSDREISYSGYVKANYGLTIGDMPLDGNFGVRVVETKSDMDAYTYSVVQDSTDPTNYTKTYTPINTKKDIVDWMPSINAKLSVRDDLFVRFAANRTITRPTFAQLNPARTLSSGGLTYAANGSSGNSDLSPVKSNNLDLGLEYYFANASNVTATVFYRQIVGYVQSSTYQEVIDSVSYSMTKPVNGGQGYLQGAELSYTQFYDFLPGIWSGLGFQANGTFIEGRTSASKTDSTKVPYANVSKYSFNLVGMYEKGPVSIRTAYNWRSSFLVGTTYFDTYSIQPSSAYAKPYGTVDLSASYRLEGTGLTITFDATNLTHEVYRDTFGKGDYAKVYPRDTRLFDQTFELGLRYRL